MHGDEFEEIREYVTEQIETVQELLAKQDRDEVETAALSGRLDALEDVLDQFNELSGDE